MEKRANFGSKLGIVLASAGSAVGLGNVWRFPTEVGANGGGAFILIYVVCVLLLGLPLMVPEFIIGRRTHANTADAFKILLREKRKDESEKYNSLKSVWPVAGYLGVFTSWFILCYYGVVAGWTLKYLVESGLGEVTRITESTAYFTQFTSEAIARSTL